LNLYNAVGVAILIPGCTDGVWATSNTAGMYLNFSCGCGPTFTAPSNNTWLNGNYLAGVGQINAVAATSDFFRLTSVVVLPGIEAPSAARSPLIMRPFDQELMTCKRYYEKLSIERALTAGLYVAGFWPCVFKRAAPTLTYTDFGLAANKISTASGGGGQTVTGGSISGRIDGIAVDAYYSGATGSWIGFLATMDARL